MAWGEKRSNGQYRAAWRDHHGKQKYSPARFLTKKAAEQFGWEQESKARLTVESARPLTWDEWLPLWQEVRVVAASTAILDRSRIEKHLRPQWGGVLLTEVKRHHVQVWVNRLGTENGLAPASVQKVFHLLTSSMRAAVDAGVLPSAAMAEVMNIKLLPAPPGLERFFTVEELAAIVRELNQPYRKAVLLMAGTGLRFGEMAGLHWQRVNTDQGTIDVVETWDRHGRSIRPYPKAAKRRTTILPEWLSDAIGPASSDATCGLPHSGHGAKCRSGLVVPSPTGRAIDSKNMFERHWKKALGAAGCEAGRQHDLRHSFASWQAQAGASIDELADLLGHASTRTTLRYRHMNGAHLRGARDRISGNRFDLLSDAAAPSSAPPQGSKIISKDT